jgi:hypothetical protein
LFICATHPFSVTPIFRYVFMMCARQRQADARLLVALLSKPHRRLLAEFITEKWMLNISSQRYEQGPTSNKKRPHARRRRENGKKWQAQKKTHEWPAVVRLLGRSVGADADDETGKEAPLLPAQVGDESSGAQKACRRAQVPCIQKYSSGKLSG